MTPQSIVEHLAPFQLDLGQLQLQQISTYIDILIRWNARMNLTAVRSGPEIVARHFGESLFAARQLFPAAASAEKGEAALTHSTAAHLIDVGSGAGFPGLPIKIWNPALRLTLIESHLKKTTFLREVVRTLTLTGVDVFSARADRYPPATGAIVTLRAVEQFAAILPTAASLVAPTGRLALLIGSAQVDQAHLLAPTFSWRPPILIPGSRNRCLLVGQGPESIPGAS